MVDALKGLVELLGATKRLTPVAFRKKLAKVGDALLEFNRLDQTAKRRGVGTSTFVVMVDALIRAAAGKQPAHDAVLRLTSEAHGRSVEKLFLSGQAGQLT
jgi:hypothetical protein